jgi:hypothetical protein
VKGHRPEIVGGVWMNSGVPMSPQPLAQARNNAYELRDLLLRATHPSLRKMQVAYGVIFPNAGELRGVNCHPTSTAIRSCSLPTWRIRSMRSIV